ncbi:tetratricopeptide repeat protein [Brevundimonas aurifodinae]|uniref:Tol-pal system protein n=2 Tax=Brevundimonas TaxID=41275 RepID=A0ABV1NJH5_9CAUL|nr:MAG: tol-pal system protein [Brevundimonas sp. 12-68-7]OYX30224.1 MAG: tol-pal system protein [Brevundimonas subvibrioides]
MNRHLTLRTLALAAVAVGVIGGAVVAQTQPLPGIQWDVRRLDNLDRNVRRLERAITQRNAQGEPVLVESDPELVALQGRVSIMDRRLQDMERTVQRVNADLERLTFQLDESDRDNAALRARLADAEGRLGTIEQAREAAETAAREAEEAAARSPTGDAVSDLAAARALLTTDPARGRAALELVASTWADTPSGREATWRIGDIIRAGGDQAGAVQQYAQALQGWPTEGWAGEVTLKLARGLEATNRDAQACAALGEYDRRYAETSTPGLRAIASQTRAQANCR